MSHFAQWLRTSNRAAIFRAAFEAVDSATMDDPALRLDLIMVIKKHATKAHHETDQQS